MSAAKLFSVEGMVVVITGGGTGIGLMMTKGFAFNGAAKVYIIGRRKEKLDEAAKLSPNIVPIVGDVTSKESLMNAAAQIKQEVGYVNMLICNSGSYPPNIKAKAGEASLQEYAKAALELNFDDYTQAFATNTVSIMFSTFAFLELLDAGNKKGNCAGRMSQVLATGSIAGFMRQNGANFAYTASKAAVTQHVKHLAGTLVSYDIRVNAIAPGLFPSDLAAPLINASAAKGMDPWEEGAIPRHVVPAQRTGSEDDMIGTVLYLASAAAAYVNGTVSVVDGGRLTQTPSTY